VRYAAWVLLDPSLREFAESAGETTRSVILELQASPVMPPTRFRSTARPARPARAPDAPSDGGAFKELERELSSLRLASKPTLLETVGMVVVDVTGEQLKRIMTLPMLAAIRPNRTHHAPRKTATDAGR